MRVKYSESFPDEAKETEAAWQLIRKIVDDRLAEELIRRLPKRPGDQIA